VTSTLPQEVRAAFERFVTCELTTVGAGQQPITWPVTPYYRQGGSTIDVTTGLGYPKKADDAKRHPSVSLLFSDPTGSGIESGIRVLVQGTAEVDDVNLAANRERYFQESGVKLPATKKMHPPKPIRGMFNWYYARI
jgi:Pyridoxamine 5'-phosphate oxidase